GLARLAEERQALERSITAAEAARGKAQAQLDAAATALAAAETGLQQMTEACATGDARRAALDRLRSDLTERYQRLQARLAESKSLPEPLLAATVSPAAVTAAGAAVSDAAGQVETGRDAAALAAEALVAAQARETTAADRARDTDRI